MAPDAPSLPSHFPCWCRAIYSWGGETKRDLGFVEGDLIECLNAGDGSWWTGRLRRDKRMVGVFPSNFVKVLEDGFVPRSRSVSPMPGLQNGTGSLSRGSISNPASVTPKKQKTVFRKPYQGYKEATPPSAVSRTPDQPTTTIPENHTTHANTEPISVPSQEIRHRWSVSQIPFHGVSHALDGERESSPPPPPPHRIAVRSQPLPRNSRASVLASCQMDNANVVPSRTPSPSSPSPATYGHTPSPLRDAMEDVMSSLHDMGLPRGAPSPEPRPFSSLNPWPPSGFEHSYDRDCPNPLDRPLTSLGLGGEGWQYDGGQAYVNNRNSLDRYHDGPPQFNNYVQRMESRLRRLHQQSGRVPGEFHSTDDHESVPPAPPLKNVPFHSRNQSSPSRERQLRNRKSAYELGRHVLGRTFTTRSNTTNSSSGVRSVATNNTTSTGLISQSVMSGPSAGGFSATSAGSLARRGQVGSLSRDRPATATDTRPGSFLDHNGSSMSSTRPHTPLSGPSYHSNHNSSGKGTSGFGWSEYNRAGDSPSIFGGLTAPKTKKTGFLKKILESAKTGAATARSNRQGGGSISPTKPLIPGGITSISSNNHGLDAAREMGLGGSVDWVQVRRDVNRSTSPSRNELVERAERCQMLDHPVIYAVEELYESAEGDESIDGLPVAEPTNWGAVNLQLVDRSARFINSLPAMTNSTSLAQGYVCRPHRSDGQRLRAIFTWVGENVAWDDDIEGNVDTRRVIQVKRGCAQEVAVLVTEMCAAVGLHAEVVRGYLKTPGEPLDFDNLSKPNHWWNAVLIDGEWRIMDCSLASPTHPRRGLYSSSSSQVADSWYFLARPLEICYTHIPLLPEQQHICPPISPDVLLALPCACPPFFKNGLSIPNYDTSLIRINGLEIVQIRIFVPPDVECVAEVEAQTFARDVDGDFFESGDVVRKRALAQADWIRGCKRFTVKAVLPGDEGQGVLKVYAGKKGLMHSYKDIPHPLAFALPISHSGVNPTYDFLLRHPTPHAQRHDLYVMQPQCARLAINNTFVFAVRQHPSSLPPTSPNLSEGGNISGRLSPNPFPRPSSALSMVSSNPSTASSCASQPFSASGSTVSSTSNDKQQQLARDKPAKLAVQTPSGKILKLIRKADHMISTSSGADSGTDGPPDGSVWETVIKVTERGVWRGLVLADRSARWCVWGEWECF